MTRYLLDTDTCIRVLRNREPVVSRVRATSPDDIVLSVITEAELWFGVLNSSDPARNRERVAIFLSASFEVVTFDRVVASKHAELRFALRKNPIGERDLIIASTATSSGFTLVSSNMREFGRVPGLDLVDWNT